MTKGAIEKDRPCCSECLSGHHHPLFWIFSDMPLLPFLWYVFDDTKGLGAVGERASARLTLTFRCCLEAHRDLRPCRPFFVASPSSQKHSSLGDLPAFALRDRAWHARLAIYLFGYR